MLLYIRMVLYFASASAAGAGLASYNPDAQTLTVNLDDLAVVLAGVGSYALTFIWSRVEKARGGKT